MRGTMMTENSPFYRKLSIAENIGSEVIKRRLLCHKKCRWEPGDTCAACVLRTKKKDLNGERTHRKAKARIEPRGNETTETVGLVTRCEGAFWDCGLDSREPSLWIWCRSVWRWRKRTCKQMDGRTWRTYNTFFYIRKYAKAHDKNF